MYNFNKIGYKRLVKDDDHNLHQVCGEVYLKVPKTFNESYHSLIHT